MELFDGNLAQGSPVTPPLGDFLAVCDSHQDTGLDGTLWYSGSVRGPSACI